MTQLKVNDDVKAQKAQKIRTQMDVLDRELMQIIETKIELALKLTKLQNADFSKAAQETVQNLFGRSTGLVTENFVKEFFSRMSEETERLSSPIILTVGYAGEHGAYAEAASRLLVPNAVYLPCLEFVDVFDGVENGIFDFGAVPVENSLEGAVTQVNDLLTSTNLKVVGELRLPIHHCLMAPAGTRKEDVRIVYSHPQALGQCRDYLLNNRFEARPFYNTAGAAKMLDRERPAASAAIAGELCAKIYGLSILDRDIEDADFNATRFQLISKRPYQGQGNKCSIIFAVKHESGALQSVLSIFSDSDINLTRISSTPRKIDPGNYTFFLDFEGSDKDPKIRSVLDEVQSRTKEMIFLGCYPKWEPAE